MKSLDLSREKWFVIGAILLSASLLSSHCLAGISIGEINGLLSCDSGWPPQAEYGPCWSPDGAKIAFAWGDGYTAWDPCFGSPNPQGSYIVIMTEDGQCIRGPDNPLVNDVGWDNHSPDWSPDGNWIVYAGSRVGPAYISRISLIDEQVVPIPTPTEHPKEPKWSPDGMMIAYRGGGWGGSPSYHICVTDRDGSSHTDLTSDITGYGVQGLSWSPDGTEIVFAVQGDPNLFVVDMNTKDINTLPGFTDSGLFPGTVAWAEENSILFVADGAIYDYQIDTQITTQLTYGPDYPGYEGAASDHLGDWHPTAGLVFSSSRNCTVRWDSNIYTAAPALTLVDIDVKPGSCPNPLNVKSKGVLPVAILGTEEFDVNTIDVASIRLDGVAPVRSSFEDVATPVVGVPGDPIAYWSFDDTCEPGHDDSGNGNNGTVNGAVSTDGICGKALNFDGSGSYVNVPSSSNLSFNTPSEPFSTSFWIKPDTILPLEQTILENEDDYIVYLYEGGLCYRKTDSGNLYHNVWHAFNAGISPNNWFHIAITYDGTGAGGTRMYVNGEEKSVTNTAYHGGGSASGDDFAIGIRAFDFATQPYAGEIDEVRIYDRALSGSEIEELAGPICDVAECECTEEGPDGYTDLTLKFETQEIVEQLGDVNHGNALQLTLTGVLREEHCGRPIEGTDCVVIKGKRKSLGGADINKDGVVDLVDFATIARKWLQSSIVED